MMSYSDILKEEINTIFHEKYMDRFITLLFNGMVDLEARQINKSPRQAWGISDDDYTFVLTKYVHQKLRTHKLKRAIEDEMYTTECDFGCGTEYPSMLEVEQTKTKNLKTTLKGIKEEQKLKVTQFL